MKAFLPVLLLLALPIGCVTKTDDSAPPTPENHLPKHPAVDIADAILLAIAEGNMEEFHRHLNATNRSKLRPDQDKKNMPGRKRKTGGATQITELVKGRRFDKTGEVCGKIRIAGNEVMVVTLVPEDGTYRFEDINSPSLKRYESLPRLGKRQEEKR